MLCICVQADEALLEQSLRYLIDLQVTDEKSKSLGAFKTQGQVIHENMLGGASQFTDLDKMVSMTAYKTIVLLEYQMGLISKMGDAYEETGISNNIALALNYLKQTVISLPNIQQKYTYVLSAFAVASAENMAIPDSSRVSTGVDLSAMEMVLDSLSSRAQADGLGLVFWQAEPRKDCGGDSVLHFELYRCYEPPTSEIEITSYALLAKLALLRARKEAPSLSDPDVAEALGAATPIVQWLVEKRNGLGG